MSFSPVESFALDHLRFEDKNSFQLQKLPPQIHEQSFSSLARFDLNGDHIDEIILQNQINDISNMYQIYGINDKDAILLGKITAQKIMISYDAKYGVRSILQFTNGDNDYDYDIYEWDAVSSQYKAIKRGAE